MTAGDVPFLVMGATGRIGGALRGQGAAMARAGLRPIWQARAPAPGFTPWDILAQPCPDGAARGVVICLAGVIHGTPAQLELNTALALAALRAARLQGGRHVFLLSSAAVYAPSATPLTEGATLAPPGDYGAAKLAMEGAAAEEWQDTGPGLTMLRVGNIAGFDALLGRLRAGVPARLDPVAGQTGGPVRSYIGPVTLARVLVDLAALGARGVVLPAVLNIAAGPVSMGSLLDAAGADWAFGPQSAHVIPQVVLDVARLQKLVDIPATASHATTMVEEWQGLQA
jgi:nucleoside-diphosphate-sugar epimerase